MRQAKDLRRHGKEYAVKLCRVARKYERPLRLVRPVLTGRFLRAGGIEGRAVVQIPIRIVGNSLHEVVAGGSQRGTAQTDAEDGRWNGGIAAGELGGFVRGVARCIVEDEIVPRQGSATVGCTGQDDPSCIGGQRVVRVLDQAVTPSIRGGEMPIVIDPVRLVWNSSARWGRWQGWSWERASWCGSAR